MNQRILTSVIFATLTLAAARVHATVDTNVDTSVGTESTQEAAIQIELQQDLGESTPDQKADITVLADEQEVEVASLGSVHIRSNTGCRTMSGVASYYGTRADGFAGKKTASGERMNPGAMTAAMLTVPLGSVVSVSHAGNTRQVRVNDRGPYAHGRIIDLSPAAARSLGIDGLGQVTIKVCGR